MADSENLTHTSGLFSQNMGSPLALSSLLFHSLHVAHLNEGPGILLNGRKNVFNVDQSCLADIQTVSVLG